MTVNGQFVPLMSIENKVTFKGSLKAVENTIWILSCSLHVRQ